MKTAILILAFIAFSFVAYLRRKEQRGTYRKVAEELGLTVDGHSFSGRLNDYVIETKQIRRKQSRYSSVGSKVLHAELRTPPRDLELDRESITSTIARKAGMQDVLVHDPRFDDTFRIGCHDEPQALAWLGNEARRAALLELNELVDSLEISNGWLVIEVPTDPVTEAEIRELLEWFVAVARRLDEPPPQAAPLPPLNLTLRARRSKWAPVLAIALVVLPLLVMGGMFVYMFWSFGMFEKREPRTSISAWTDGRGMSIPAKDEFLACVRSTPKTPDVDFSECEQLALNVNLQFTDVRDAYMVMRTVQGRRAARVDLDRDEVEQIIKQIRQETAGSRSFDKFVAEEVVPLYWDFGLHDRYFELVEIEDGPRAEVPTAIVNLDVLYNGGESLPASSRAYLREHGKYLMAIHCLHDRDTRPAGRDAELSAACGAAVRDRELATVEVQLAALETNPKDTTRVLTQRGPDRIEPEVQLAFAAHRFGQESQDEPPVDYAALAEALPPVQCLSPWTADDAFGDPEKLLALAENAEPVANRLRLYAARQYALMSKVSEAQAALAPVTTGREAVCAAQLETAFGAAPQAIERLAALEDSHGGLRPLAQAQAHLVAGEWKDALGRGQEALAELGSGDRDHAAIVVAAAAMKLRQEDGLDDTYGPVGSISELAGDDPVDVTRWFARAGQDELEDAADRWIAPTLPLLPGSEPVQYFVAAAIAGDGDDEHWLNIVMPEQFEALAVAQGRRVAATLRGDEDAAEAWREVEGRHLEHVTSPEKARLYRIARRHTER